MWEKRFSKNSYPHNPQVYSQFYLDFPVDYFISIFPKSEFSDMSRILKTLRFTLIYNVDLRFPQTYPHYPHFYSTRRVYVTTHLRKYKIMVYCGKSNCKEWGVRGV